MPDRPTFGKRGAEAAAGIPWADGTHRRGAVEATRLSAPPAGPAGGYGVASRSLDLRSERIRLAGELTAFVGLMLAFLAIHFWPEDPARLKELEGLIFIPATIAGQLTFNDPGAPRGFADMTSTEIGMDNVALLFIALAGLVALLRERWVFAGLISAFWLIPWSLFDYHLLPATIVIYVYAVVAFFRLYRPSWPVRAALFAIAVVASPMMIKSFSFLYGDPISDPDRPRAEYRMVKLAELIANQGRPATEVDADGTEIIRAVTLLGLDATGPDQRAAKAYVAAQELALRGDPAPAAAALEESLRLGFAPEPYNARRVEAIRRHVTAAGAFGPEAGQALLSQYTIRSTIAWWVAAIGMVLGLMGPFADVFAGMIGRRARRIADGQAKLEARRAAAGRDSVQANFQERPGSAAVQSIAALDGEAMLAAMAARLRQYGTATAILAALAVASFLGSSYFWLPPADSNAAFHTVALAGDAIAMARDAGVATSHEGRWAGAGVTIVYAMIGGVLAWLVFSRKHMRLVLAGSVAVLAMSCLGTLALTERPYNQVAPAALNHNVRAVLLRSLAPGKDAGAQQESAIRPMQPDKSLPSFSDVARDINSRAPRDIGSQTAREPGAIGRSTAAYILAQIAYIENRPAEAGRMLARIADPGALTTRMHRQRADLMVEWVAAKGQGSSPDLRRLQLSIPMSFTRGLAVSLLAIGAASAALSAVLLLLLVLVQKRRRHIGLLVAERRLIQRNLVSSRIREHLGKHKTAGPMVENGHLR